MSATLLRVSVVIALLVPFGLQADPLKNPKRVVSGQTADLKPLFDWWKHHGTERPLPAWVHLTGTVVGTNGWGWIVQAQLEDTPGRHGHGQKSGGTEKIILKTPPAQEYAAFLNLRAQLQVLNAEHAQLAAQEAHAGRHAKDATPAGRRHTRAERIQARQARQVEAEAKNELKPVDKRIEEVKKQLQQFPAFDHYVVDCFALDTHQEHDGLPVLDHGLPMK